jgi:enoyl-CoA hydratase
MSVDTLVEQDGRILRITFNHPERGNTVGEPQCQELTSLLISAHETADLVVLGSVGEDFCAGRAPGSKSGTEMDAWQMHQARELIFNCYDAFRKARVPVLGVVRGRAHGLGCALAALCDITLAADTASFRIPEMAANLLPTMVLSALHDRVPLKALNYLVYSTADITAAEAVVFGIASHVVPADRLDVEAATLAGAITRQPRPAVMGAKEYIANARTMHPATAVAFAQHIHAVVNTAAEMKKK